MYSSESCINLIHRDGILGKASSSGITTGTQASNEAWDLRKLKYTANNVTKVTEPR